MVRKLLPTLLAIMVMAVVVVIVGYNSKVSTADKLAVAYAFGKMQAFLSSSNYIGAYEMMSADFRNTRSVDLFRKLNETKATGYSQSNLRLSDSAEVVLRKATAELRIDLAPGYAYIFFFVKENGQWHIADKNPELIEY